MLRPAVLPRLEHRAVVDHHFGRPDAHGIVGESQACWALRDQIAFVGRRSAHVLVAGESGTGKELISRAIHRLSSRGGKRLVSRNAATIPDTLIDAELFGNLPNYPNPGTPERRGLIGEAEGSSLFFDEIGELPLSAQAHLLRVLDAGGEYHRLGESRARNSDIRLIAATNREPDRLKEDLLARLTLHVHSPSLNERREDVPLLAAMLLGQIAASDPEACSPFCEGGSDTRIPRFRSELMFALVEHDYTAHVRELESLLWIALASSRGDALALTAEVKHALSGKRSPVTAARKITREELLRALEQHDWVRERVWKALGLSNRFVLNRLLKKHRILPGVEENGRDE